jgi:hypothetical protein
VQKTLTGRIIIRLVRMTKRTNNIWTKQLRVWVRVRVKVWISLFFFHTHTHTHTRPSLSGRLRSARGHESADNDSVIIWWLTKVSMMSYRVSRSILIRLRNIVVVQLKRNRCENVVLYWGAELYLIRRKFSDTLTRALQAPAHRPKS